MMMDWIQIVLTLWLIERVSIERRRYKLALDTNGGFPKGYWSIWVYCKKPRDDHYNRNGGKRLIAFNNYIIPKLR